MLFSDFLSLRYPEPNRNLQDFDSSFTDIHSHFLHGLNHFPSPIFLGDLMISNILSHTFHKKTISVFNHANQLILNLKNNHFTKCHEKVLSLRTLCVNYFEVWEVIYRKATEAQAKKRENRRRGKYNKSRESACRLFFPGNSFTYDFCVSSSVQRHAPLLEKTSQPHETLLSPHPPRSTKTEISIISEGSYCLCL